MNEMHTVDNEILLGEVCSLLRQGKKVKLRAKGDSMRPFIHGNEDLLVLAPIITFQIGDVVLAKVDRKGYVIHRIIKMRNDKITLKGDGNLYEKEDCQRQDIYGCVESVTRKGKECDLRSPGMRLCAKAWNFLLPFRRAKAKINNIIRRR